MTPPEHPPKASPSSVLIIEDSAPLAMTYAAQLGNAGYDVEVCGSGYEAGELLQNAHRFSVILLDLQLPDTNGLDFLKEQAAAAGDANIIVVTGDGSLNRAVEAMRLGARDFVVKPVSGERLLAAVDSAVNSVVRLPSVRTERASVPNKAVSGQFHEFIGGSAPMRKVYQSIQTIACSAATVFITGESGTGKEVAAEAIHREGQRAAAPFIAINCGAIPENLLESELFGHVKGAFTGALDDRIGAARAADGGTLFLDEICEMELKLQVKLLRFLQTGMIQRVGESTPEPVDVRVICATNRIPAEEVAQGRFRADLYYRLNVIPLGLPPLRERGDDVVQIAKALFRRFASEEGRDITRLSENSVAALTSYDWPGNVRELQNTIRRAVIMGEEPQLGLDLATNSPDGAIQSSQQFRAIPPEIAPTSSPTFAGLTMEAIEEIVISERIKTMEGNVAKAARSLAISPSTVFRRLERWNAAA